MHKFRDLEVNKDYYLENILKKHILNDQSLKNYSNFGGIFQHDQAKAHMVTAVRELLEEYSINFIEWLPDLSPIELSFGVIQRRAAKEHYSNIKTQD
jgi:hypothetical protein